MMGFECFWEMLSRFPYVQKFKPSYAFLKHCFLQRFSRLKYSSSRRHSFLLSVV